MRIARKTSIQIHPEHGRATVMTLPKTWLIVLPYGRLSINCLSDSGKLSPCGMSRISPKP